MDTIIKYFTVGFIFSIALARLFEKLLLTIYLMLVALLYVIFDCSEVNNLVQKFASSTTSNRYDYYNNDMNDGNHHNSSNSTFTNTNDLDGMKEITEQFVNSHPILFISFYFFNSFIVAAVTEELCNCKFRINFSIY